MSERYIGLNGKKYSKTVRLQLYIQCSSTNNAIKRCDVFLFAGFIMSIMSLHHLGDEIVCCLYFSLMHLSIIYVLFT